MEPRFVPQPQIALLPGGGRGGRRGGQRVEQRQKAERQFALGPHEGGQQREQRAVVDLSCQLLLFVLLLLSQKLPPVDRKSTRLNSSH